jgi:hypothetical protein
VNSGAAGGLLFLNSRFTNDDLRAGWPTARQSSIASRK